MSNVIPLRTLAEAVAYGDKWRIRAERMEILLFCAEAHAMASETLREYAEAELERVRGNTGDI